MGDPPIDNARAELGGGAKALSPTNKPKNKREKRKIANRARHRLLSIRKDANAIEDVIKPLLIADDAVTVHDDWPWIANKQCGSWYLPKPTLCSCYFKSTDGHVGTYNVSLKRLNLPLLKVLSGHQGCVLVDSSVRKLLPDSFSRTIPIWACVLNRIAKRYREELSGDGGLGSTSSITKYWNDTDWDVGLYTPASVVSPEEHIVISDLIDSRVDLLYQSKAIVDPEGLAKLLTKPVRAVWWSNGRYHTDTLSSAVNESLDWDKYHVIVCCNPSSYIEEDGKLLNKNHIQWQDGPGDNGFYYTPGAADDHDTWARGLTPELLWMHEHSLGDLSSLTEDHVDAIIDDVVKSACQDALGDTPASPQIDAKNANKIGESNLWIGSRRAGRPPECWDSFDAILNVTENEYPNMIKSMETSQKPCFYLQLVVAEGKRDKTQLERLLPLGLAFLLHHMRQGRRTLVHCAQGKDRSVAIAVASVALFCPKVYPLKLSPRCEEWDLELLCKGEVLSIGELEQGASLYGHSGLPLSLIRVLLSESARDDFLRWYHACSKVPTSTSLATKESIRISLHLIQQDREVADPTRSTMQKLNRFFMSSSMYR
ncbi:unnamed protein product [Cylindrotheca closterium]|uniref:Uncharacterized protein n=1 Tax=Cylindrotheca closterium TaxID=2856 RepID=A0AAD2G981_9STRA|nr:unnamed protein product [Cylindrotheca closterium]